MDQVNTVVSQMDKVTQQNAANAEESASASEERSAQAESMKEIVGQLVALVGGEFTEDPIRGSQHRASPSPKTAGTPVPRRGEAHVQGTQLRQVR